MRIPRAASSFIREGRVIVSPFNLPRCESRATMASACMSSLPLAILVATGSQYVTVIGLHSRFAVKASSLSSARTAVNGAFSRPIWQSRSLDPPLVLSRHDPVSIALDLQERAMFGCDGASADGPCSAMERCPPCPKAHDVHAIACETPHGYGFGSSLLTIASKDEKGNGVPRRSVPEWIFDQLSEW